MHYHGISQRSIAPACECSRNTVSKTINAAFLCSTSWEERSNLSNDDVLKKIFPERIAPSSIRLPGCEYIHKEMAKSGVTLSLLWTEYCEVFRLSGEILISVIITEIMLLGIRQECISTINQVKS